MTAPVVAFLSGGTGSWAATRRYLDLHGPDRFTCVFTDVGDGEDPFTGEDADTYRFLHDAVANLGVELVYLRDGRNIWDVFQQKSWLGNSSLSHCSWELKTKPALAWVKEHMPADTMLLLGIDWTEADRRLPAIHKNWAPYRVIAPMADRPFLGKLQVAKMLRDNGLRGPRLTEALGFAHANCIVCVKGGHGHFARVLDVFPEHYAYAERREQEFRDLHGDVSILKDRTGGELTPLTLREFRERQQAGGQVDLFDIGGCGCFVEEPAA